jgi:cobalamin biosynthesis Co2+ chelatase CbiK
MRTEIIVPKKKKKILVRKCHVCGEVIESYAEVEKCHQCHKHFLPLNYFGKVHATNSEAYKQLFEEVNSLHEDDLIKGLFVIW